MNKQKIALLTDSCADIPDALLKQYDIHVVPLKLIFSDGEYADGVDIIPSEVYRRLPSEMPKTTLPSGESVEQVLGQIRKKGYSRVLAIHLSGGLSGTCNLVRVVGAQTDGMEVAVFDTQSGSLGIGMTVLQAARWIEQGWSWNELLRAIPPLIRNTHVFFLCQYLRISAEGRKDWEDIRSRRHAPADQTDHFVCGGRGTGQRSQSAWEKGCYAEDGANDSFSRAAWGGVQSGSCAWGFTGRASRDPRAGTAEYERRTAPGVHHQGDDAGPCLPEGAGAGGQGHHHE